MQAIPDLAAAVRRGNIVRDLAWLQRGMHFIPPYVANGAVGGSVDEWGMHHRCNYDMDGGRTHLTHVDHFSHYGDKGGHILRSFGHMFATDARGRKLGLGLVSQWQQELDLWTASCETIWTEAGSRYRTEVFASWAQPQLWCWTLGQQLADADDTLVLRWEFDVRRAENNARNQTRKIMEQLTVRIDPAGEGLWRIVSTTDCHATEMLLRVDGGQVQLEGTDLVITAEAGGVALKALFLDRHLPEDISADPAAFLARDDHRDAHRDAVETHWRRSGMIVLPQGHPEGNWWPRYAYYLPASLSPNPSHVQVATGLNANNWSYGFPQDQWYVMMALPRLGLHELTAAQMPCYAEDLPAYERYARRLANREGVFFPWEPPFEKLDEFETDQATGANAFQLHSAAYPLAMAWESYRVHRDEDFLRRHAGMIEGVARFLAGNCQPGEGGYIFRNDDIPLRSQDEGTPHGAETVQPICAVWSSMYCFKAFLATREILGEGDADLASRVEEILQTGFDFGPLLRDDGLLRTSGTDPRPLGLQKHPPQLNPLTYVPQADWMDYEPVLASWRRRYELCKATREPKSLGWTFGQFLLASVRLFDGAAAESDLNLVQPARFADAEWIQFYETSDRNGWTMRMAYYFTVMGLYVMAMLDTVVQDYRERVDVLPALLPRWSDGPVAWQRLCLRDGMTTSGTWHGGWLEMEITAANSVETSVVIHPAGRYELTVGETTRRFASGEQAELKLPAGQTARIVSVG